MSCMQRQGILTVSMMIGSLPFPGISYVYKIIIRLTPFNWGDLLFRWVMTEITGYYTCIERILLIVYPGQGFTYRPRPPLWWDG